MPGKVNMLAFAFAMASAHYQSMQQKATKTNRIFYVDSIGSGYDYFTPFDLRLLGYAPNTTHPYLQF